jgi:hypothetical protein
MRVEPAPERVERGELTGRIAGEGAFLEPEVCASIVLPEREQRLPCLLGVVGCSAP